MKSIEQWKEFIKKKSIRAKRDLSFADLALDNPEHYYNIYIKQGTSVRKSKSKDVSIPIKKETPIDYEDYS